MSTRRPSTASSSFVLEEEPVLEEYLSDEKLRLATGEENLANVTTITLIVETSENSIGEIGRKLPNLTQLRLNNSSINCIRDLGTGLSKLQVLWLSRCNLTDLDGIFAIPRLRELYLAFNDINDLTPLGDLEYLEIVDLEGNAIDDLSQIQFLQSCSRLTSLTLEGNPAATNATTTSEGGLAGYRKRVFDMLPQLRILDDYDKSTEVPKTARPMSARPPSRMVGGDRASSPNLENEAEEAAEILKEEQERQMINDSLKYARLDFDTEVAEISAMPQLSTITPRQAPIVMRPTSARPSTASGGARPGTATMMGGRPGTSSSSNPFFMGRPSTPSIRPATARPTTAARPGSARPMSARSGGGGSAGGGVDAVIAALRGDAQDTSSELTFGSKDVICGNPVKSLRSRKIENSSDSLDPLDDDESLLEHVKNFKLQKAVHRDYDSYDREQDELIQELNSAGSLDEFQPSSSPGADLPDAFIERFKDFAPRAISSARARSDTPDEAPSSSSRTRKSSYSPIPTEPRPRSRSKRSEGLEGDFATAGGSSPLPPSSSSSHHSSRSSKPPTVPTARQHQQQQPQQHHQDSSGSIFFYDGGKMVSGDSVPPASPSSVARLSRSSRPRSREDLPPQPPASSASSSDPSVAVGRLRPNSGLRRSRDFSLDPDS